MTLNRSERRARARTKPKPVKPKQEHGGIKVPITSNPRLQTHQLMLNAWLKEHELQVNFFFWFVLGGALLFTGYHFNNQDSTVWMIVSYLAALVSFFQSGVWFKKMKRSK